MASTEPATHQLEGDQPFEHSIQQQASTQPTSPSASRPEHIAENGSSSPSSGHMGPPHAKATNGKAAAQTQGQRLNGEDKTQGAGGATAGGAAAASQQPKVIQTAFIHKLYNMLEDQSIQHLISWSSSGESFLISPSSDFSKVLSSYFKHTNVSSFVRQLNMYGFHKVSDVFQTGSPDSPLWEFKHGNGNFRRGDLTGLREIKRRASRHTLIHRDSFSGAPKGPVTAGNVAVEPLPDTLESRVAALEQALWDVHGRLSRSEDVCAHLAARCTNTNDHLLRALQLNYDMSNTLLAMVPDRNSQLHANTSSLQASILHRLEQAKRDLDAYYSGPINGRQALAGQDDQLSPRARPQQDHRLDTMPALPPPAQTPFYRPLAPSSRGAGSFSGPAGFPSAATSSVGGFAPPLHAAMQPAHQHPLATIRTPSTASSSGGFLPRRHTSADIRSDGWKPENRYDGSEAAPLPNVHTRWPSPGTSSGRLSIHQHAPEVLPKPSMTSTTGSTPYEHDNAPSTPPHAPNESRWTAIGGKIPFKDVFKNTGVGSDARLHSPGSTSGPPTRRSSVANIHMMLNPADVAEKEGEDRLDAGGGPEDLRKRRRLE